MRRSDKHIHELDRIDKEAAEWFVKIDLGLSRDESIAYKSWLEKDSRHKSRMEWYERTWNRFTPIEEFDDAEEEAFWPESSEPVGVRSRYARYLWVFGSFAAVLLVGFLVWRWGGKSEEFVEYESRFAVSAYENRILADGSILELNKGARAKVRFTDTQRGVWLHEGEVYFHVVKDPNRPFIVHAGDTQIRAVGTAFNVKRDKTMVQVVVTEGRINLTQSPLLSGEKERDAYFSQEMDAGQVSTLDNEQDLHLPVVNTYTYEELSGFFDWKPATLEFEATPLGDVVMAFNKRNDIQIILADDELETMPIEATFRSDNVLAFARLLEVTFELKAERPSQNEIILSLPH